MEFSGQKSDGYADLGGRRLVIVSNRLPFNVSIQNGRVEFHPSAGGLVTGLASFREARRQATGLPAEHLWVGWPGASVDPSLRDDVIRESAARFQSYPVFLTEEQMEQFYLGFCNATIWPLFHYFPTYADYRPAFWQQYKRINQLFADSLAEILRPDDVVWVHDYHLMLLPRLLKSRQPQSSVGFFLHIPFPSFEVFRLLPGEWRREILDGLLGADLIGFHTYEYTHHFFQSVLRILGYDCQMGQVMAPDRIVRVETFPMGIDFEKFAGAPGDAETENEARELKQTLAGIKAILSVDRLDYSKGILNRLEGYELFLESHPEYHGKVSLLMVVVPSRIGVLHYDLMKRQIEELVGKINGQFGRVGWTPVVYQYRHVPFQSLAALYAVSDVCLVTPLRDGMNLVAKEYLATRADGGGALVLSEMAGAAKELPEAIVVNPNNRAEISAALKEALETPLEEQKRRNRAMQRRLRRYNVSRWANDFLSALLGMREVQARIESKLLSRTARQEIVARYRSSSSRLLFLDYDGTLTPLARYPALAKPDGARLEFLRALAADPKNSVVVVSGRDRGTLDQWFGQLPVGLIAEHGAWLKPREQDWHRAKPLSGAWKQQLLPILETYADRLPGAFVEEKEDSLAWHYRMADPEQAEQRASELTDHLLHLTAKTDLQIVQGSKVVEIRRAGVDKGSASLAWTGVGAYDFILGIGDDTTDEDLFKALPKTALSIRVGMSATHAQYNLRSSAEVVELLRLLAAAGEPAAKTFRDPASC
ncbi:MAG TPA: bifunctional alpha,alpha-trehalose-phosphate synthase (UDP-forming)/trehalose-phosphatase [Candidatus Binatia bacterium]|nr:bifunctional alpha,alpha-trehalose-phosphate synthase (UDP-forming)/trehalose-phosphatase [Candidatus Binatia bacterium]